MDIHYCPRNFIQQYDAAHATNENDVEFQIINDNFTYEEITRSIERLKNNKSPGIDGIPSEFIKYCKNTLVRDIVLILNYIIEKRQFPVSWSEGVRHMIHKTGNRLCPENYRGITILPIIEKIFELTVYNRLQFANEAFGKIDRNNGGFLQGHRTADNIFVLNGIIQRQLLMGKSLFICYVDFSKAFDLISRHILFYKVMSFGWKGRVIDTLRHLYQNTQFRIKQNGKLSLPIRNTIGVNQGGVASGLLFRKYMSDLACYLDNAFGVCINDHILAHLLWADDLILFSDSPEGLQRQLNGLFQFCSKNKMIVNETKTKIMAFGSNKRNDWTFNGKRIDITESYKYLGNIFRETKRCSQDVFSANYDYLLDKARKAIFATARRTKHLGPVPPDIAIYLFNSIIMPILQYGSEVWGINKVCWPMMDRMCLKYLRYILGVKSNTNNSITFGECGIIPPSVKCQISSICFLNRLAHLPDSMLVKKVYNELARLDSLGFSTWVTKAFQLSESIGINAAECEPNNFKSVCKQLVSIKFVTQWESELQNCGETSILRFYKLIKHSYGIEPYLTLVKEYKYRNAISKFRCSSHMLEIEKGRHVKPKVPLNQRLCKTCNVLDDEFHFVFHCNNNAEERKILFSKIRSELTHFMTLATEAKLTFICKTDNPKILTWFGKFLFDSFQIRRSLQAVQL